MRPDLNDGFDEFEDYPASFSQAANNNADAVALPTAPLSYNQWNPAVASVASNAAAELSEAVEIPVVFPDSVHKQIRLPAICGSVVATPQFHRLGGLRQLGNAPAVFPAARHTRFEHSLGVAHLTRLHLESLLSRQPELVGSVGARDVRNVVLAGLCHDLGHGPLSHVFEKEFLRLHGVTDWEHEAMSTRILRHLVADPDNGIQDIDDADIAFIEGVIRGRPPPGCTAPRFLFDIVSNDRNGVDTDRMDYLVRDALHCGVTDLAADVEPLLAGAKVLDGQICYPLARAADVWAVFSERMRMFRSVYTCRRVKAAELMAVEALHAAEPVLGLLDMIHEPETFCALDDSILQTIEHYHRRHPRDLERLEPEARAALGRAQSLLRELAAGRLFPCCGEVQVPAELLCSGGRWESELRREFTSEALLAHVEDAGERAELAGQLAVNENRIEAGKGGGDPMEKVGFYDDCDASGGSRLLRLSAEQLSGLGRPACLQERTLRVFLRRSDRPGLEAAARRALARWCSARLGAGRFGEEDVAPREEAACGGAEAAPGLARRAALLESDLRRAAVPCAASAPPPAPHTPSDPRVGSCAAAAAVVAGGGRIKRFRLDDHDDRED